MSSTTPFSCIRVIQSCRQVIILVLFSLLPFSVQATQYSPELLYQERFAYVVMLFEAITRHNSDVVNSHQHREAESLLSESRVLRQERQYEQGLSLLDKAIELLETVSSQRPLQEREKSRYLSLQEGLPYFEEAYLRHFQKEQVKRDIAFGYSQSMIQQMVAEAQMYADHQRYGEASVVLRSAQARIAAAIKEILDHQQIGTVAYRAIPNLELGRSAQEIAQAKYQRAVDSIVHFQAAHSRQKEGGEFQVVSFDKALVDWLLSEAAGLAEQQRYEAALEVVSHVRSLITKALRDTLNGQNIVVKLDISTPELEYAYEYRRYLGYEELIAVAVERMRPNDEALVVMAHYHDQGVIMAQQAEKQFAAGEVPIAIRMVLDATRSIQLALRTAGVPIYDAR